MEKAVIKNGWRSRLWQAMPWLWIVAGYLFDLWYQLVPGRWIVDSDLASEMILADLLNQEGSIISHNWYYSTELKVVNLQWFYRIGLVLFPNDWHLARAFGMAIALVLYAVALLLLARWAGLGRAGLWMTGALLWPFGQHYLVYSIFGGYYLVYTTFYLFVLALLLRSMRTDIKRCILLWAVACVIAMISGTNGVKQIMVFHAPLLLATTVATGLALHDCGKRDWKSAIKACQLEVRFSIGAVLSTIACGIGYAVNLILLSGPYTFKSFGGIRWNRSDDWFTLDRIVTDFFHEFGYQNDAYLFRFSGIATGFGLLLGAVVFICTIRLVLKLRKLETEDRLLVMLLVSMILVCSVCYTYFQEYNNYYWMTVIPAAIAVVAVELKTESFHLQGVRKAAGVSLALVVTICSIHTVRREIEKPLLAHEGIEQPANWLVENGYYQGYASFWNANALAYASDGQLEVWTLVNLNDDVVMDWLQKIDHTERDPEHPFLLIDTKSDGTAEQIELIGYGDCKQVYADDRYEIYVFDSATDVHEAAELARVKN